MTTNLIKKKVNTFFTGEAIVETDQHSKIIIHETPEGLAHVTSNDAVRHQLTNMMAFQEKISMLFRATLKSNGLNVPLSKRKYRVEVKVKSAREISELFVPNIKCVSSASPLLNVLKSVIDGLNGQIISNDSQIGSAEILYERLLKTRSPKMEYLEVALYDTSLKPAGLIAHISTDIFVLPKEQPLVYNVDNKIVALHESHHEDFAVQLKPIITLPKYSLYHIDVEFIGDVQRLDVDNMSKIYLPVLNKLGIKDDDIHRISMSKRIKKNHSGAISLQVNPH